MATTTIGGYLIERLLALGVRHIFGVPGDFVLGFYDLLTRSELVVVNTSDEQGAGFAADGYARINGIGAVCVTYGVGGLKVVNTTAEAYAEKSPVVVISGGPGVRERVHEPLVHHKIKTFQSQLNIFREVTTASAIIDDPATAQREIDRVLSACLRHSRPVYIELPRDLALAPIEVGEPHLDAGHSDDIALDEALDAVRQLVAAAKQPVILLGEELHRFEVHDTIPALLEASGIPCASTTLSKSVVDESHPLYLGVYQGVLANEEVRAYVEGSDCLLILGANLSDVTLGINTAHLDPSRSILLTSEDLMIRRSHYQDVRFKDFVLRLPEVLGTRPWPEIPRPHRPEPWVAQPGVPVTVARLFQCLNGFLAKTDVVVSDVGDALFGATDLYVEDSGFVAPAYYLSLGFGVPAAIGVQLAHPAIRPLVIVGDGAFQMTGMELSTAVRYQADHGLSPIVILLDNKGYGTERPMLDGPFNDINAWDYAALPSVLQGGVGHTVRTEDDLDRALAAARAETGTFSLVHVHLAIGDISPTLRRLTEALGKRVR
ncbi:MAG: thiamine pyrophosphate-binding protein [Chloroflexota bacterium]